MRTILAALAPIARVALFWVAAFSVSRILLMAVLSERVAAAGGVGFILLQGLRFDLVTVGMLLGPLALLAPLAAGARWFAATARIYLVAVTALAFFVEAATLPFVREYDARPNILFVEYLAYPREVFATLANGHVLQLVTALALVALASWVAARLGRTRPSTLRAPLLGRLVMSFVVLLAVAAMIRSTLDHRPVNPSTVAYANDSLVNQLPLNSPYTLMYAVYEQRRDGDAGAVRYGDIEPAEAVAVVLEEAHLADGNRDWGSPTMHRHAPTRRVERPLNLVIILEESLGAEFSRSLGGEEDLTPRIDDLADEGIWFERLYATGTRSVRGIEAVITGFVPTPRRSVVKLAETQSHFFTLATLLGQQGYRSGFIYGGEAHFDNMARFFLDNGFDFVIDENDYEDPVFRAVWGVSDEDLFGRVHETLEAGRDDGPLFLLAFSSSNHDPFDIPPGRVEPLVGEEAARRTAVKYADWAVGEYLEMARASDYWDDTVFLVIADHNSRTYGDELVPIERFHIPGVILGGPVEPRRVPGVSSQIDMLPTLLSLLGVEATLPAIGRDLTRPEWADGAGRAIMQFNRIQAYLEGDAVVVLRPDLEPALFRLSPENRLVEAAGENPALVRRALAHAALGPLEIAQGLYFDPSDPPPAAQHASP